MFFTAQCINTVYVSDERVFQYSRNWLCHQISMEQEIATDIFVELSTIIIKKLKVNI